MNRNTFRLRLSLLSFALIASLYTCEAKAQATGQVPPPRPSDNISADKSKVDDKSPLTTFEEEIRAKRLIKMAEKEHEENLKRAREISQLSEDLTTNLKTRSALDREDTKKLERLEKLTKKIRGEAGGEDDDVQIVNLPYDV
jgi:hypothetical protein